jgi:hypothetical protein
MRLLDFEVLADRFNVFNQMLSRIVNERSGRGRVAGAALVMEDLLDSKEISRASKRYRGECGRSEGSNGGRRRDIEGEKGA